MGQLRKGGSFAACDAEGRRFRIVNWIEYVDLTDGQPGHPRWEPSGFECLRLDDGRAVSVQDGTRYEIAGTGLLLERVDDEPERSAHAPVPASNADLMATIGIRRSGRFYLCRGYRYTHIWDAVAYARLARDRPALAQQEPHWEQSRAAAGAADPDAPRAQDAAQMAHLCITFAQGQYVFDGFRYDRLQDAVAYARLQQSRSAP